MERPTRQPGSNVRQPARRKLRRAELVGGPMDGGTVGEPLERLVHFILVPNDGRGGPLPVHTYAWSPTRGRYHYCG